MVLDLFGINRFDLDASQFRPRMDHDSSNLCSGGSASRSRCALQYSGTSRHGTAASWNWLNFQGWTWTLQNLFGRVECLAGRDFGRLRERNWRNGKSKVPKRTIRCLEPQPHKIRWFFDSLFLLGGGSRWHGNGGRLRGLCWGGCWA